MAAVNSSVVGLKLAAAVPQAVASSPAKRVSVAPGGRRAALLGLAAVFAVTATTGSAKAGIIDEYLEKSQANKVCSLRGNIFQFISLGFTGLLLI
jgi:photosystem I subunit PsaN